MARVEKQKLISDVILKLTQAFPSQDLELEDDQVAFWLTQEVNFLVTQEVVKAVNQGKPVPPVYLTRETCNQTSEEDVTCVDDNKERFFFELTGEVLDVENDAGVVQVLTDEYEEVYKANIELLPTLQAMRYTKPKTELLVWYRESARVFVDGFNNADIEFNKIMVTYVPKQDLIALADDGIVKISDLLLPLLIDRAVETGKLQMYGTQPDTSGNDSTDVKGMVYHRSIQNPSAQPQQQE
jgi:hypothetical protein